MWPLIAGALCIVGAQSAVAQTTFAETPIVFVEPVRVAFYEAVPPSIERSMLKAVREVCGDRGGRLARSGRIAEGARTPWFCGERALRFFRGVDVLGNRQRTGLVCGAESVTPNLKYYTEDMFGEDAACIPISYELAGKRHIVEIEQAK